MKTRNMTTIKSGSSYILALPTGDDIIPFVSSLTPDERENLMHQAAQNCVHRNVPKLISLGKEHGETPIPLAKFLAPTSRSSGSFSAEWLKRLWNKLFVAGHLDNAAPAKAAKEAAADAELSEAAQQLAADKYEREVITLADLAPLKWADEQAQSAI